MKKVFAYIAFVVSIGMVISGCYYDEVGSDGPLPTNVSFINDVIPILNKNCNTSGCHDQVPTAKPSLVRENAYSALKNGSYLNTVAPLESKLMQVINDGRMPPSGEMSTLDKNIILAWITEGAKNN